MPIFIKLSNEILHLQQKTRRFRSIWHEQTREMPWIWHRANSRHHEREFISSPSRDMRYFHLDRHIRVVNGVLLEIKYLMLIYLIASLYLNGGLIGSGKAQDANEDNALLIPLTVQSTLNLQKGDQVWVQLLPAERSNVILSGHDSTHFTGFILEEEIVASLWDSILILKKYRQLIDKISFLLENTRGIVQHSKRL